MSLHSIPKKERAAELNAGKDSQHEQRNGVVSTCGAVRREREV